ncbi:Type II and III secretion system protein [Rhodospirillaceae bacterium LM-1]|nr:Type II and III secretion system protein [Rhodospirillaceae bacterium LM-1]
MQTQKSPIYCKLDWKSYKQGQRCLPWGATGIQDLETVGNRDGQLKDLRRNAGRGLVVLAALAVVLSLSSCNDKDLKYDRGNGLSKDDYEALKDRRPPEAKPKEAPPIPDLQPVLAAPAPPNSLETRLVSIEVNDSVPLKDVLMELTRKASVDLELDPNVSGGIIFSAHERPFPQVIDRISELAGLRYSLKNNVLRVELDTMYQVNYRLDAINLIRKSASKVETNTDVFAAVSGGSAAGGNSSSSSVDGSSEADLWKEVGDNVKQILQNSDPRNQPSLSQSQLGKVNPNAASAQPAANPNGASQQGASQSSGSQMSIKAQNVANPVAAAQNVANTTAAAVNQATNDGAQPAAAAGAEPSSGASAQAASASAAYTSPTLSYHSVNKQAGLVTIFGNSRQQKLVKAYLDQVKAAISTQVLIEAKVVEVTLADAFKTGINWRSLTDRNINFAAPLGISSTTATGSTVTTLPTTGPPFTAFNTATTGVMTLGYLNQDIGALVSLIKEFGTVRTLSSPRLTVMNNQTAVLKVAENEVYFRTEIQTTVNNGVSSTNYTSTMNTVPIGLVMTVQPSVNLDTDEIALGMRPTISRIARRVNDPAVDLQAAAAGSTITSAVPVVEVREMDSVVTIPTGRTIIMGGLMQERIQKDTQGIPGAQDIPLLGNLFKAQADSVAVTELVVLIRASVIKAPEKSVSPADRDLYQKYTRDPRPLTF